MRKFCFSCESRNVRFPDELGYTNIFGSEIDCPVAGTIVDGDIEDSVLLPVASLVDVILVDVILVDVILVDGILVDGILVDGILDGILVDGILDRILVDGILDRILVDGIACFHRLDIVGTAVYYNPDTNLHNILFEACYVNQLWNSHIHPSCNP